jgi:hypothetical protein
MCWLSWKVNKTLMASIVKANYRTASSGGLTAVLGSISYYAYRRDQDGQRVEREGFSRDTDGLNTVAMRDVIRQTEGDYYYRLVLSPGAEQETEVDLQTWTRDSLLTLEKEHGEFPYVAIEHRDQTDYAHVHIVLVVNQKFDKEDLQSLRDYSTELFEPRQQVYEVSRELPERHTEREVVDYSEGYVTPYHEDPEAAERLKRSRDRLFSR